MVRKIIISVSIFIVVSIVLIFALLHFDEDEPAPYDDDLRLPAVNILPQENAFFSFKEAVEKMYFPYQRKELLDDVINGKKWDKDFVKELLEKNKETFYFVNQAVLLPKFQFPEFQNPESVSLGYLLPEETFSIYKIAQIELIKAKQLFYSGKEKEAFDEIFKILHLAQSVEDSPRPIDVQYISAVSAKKISLKVMQDMVGQIISPSESLKSYIEKLNRFKGKTDASVILLKLSYMRSAKAFDSLKTNEETRDELIGFGLPFYVKLMIKSDHFYKPNQTKRFFATVFRKQIENLNHQYYSETEHIETQFLFFPPLIVSLEKQEKGFEENYIGKMIYETSAIDISQGQFVTKCMEDFSVIATQLLLAIKDYQLKYGEIPDSLSRLIPEYFSKLPKDPFDGQPVRFLPGKKIIYSVGRDLKDSGGGEDVDFWDKWEPALKIKF